MPDDTCDCALCVGVIRGDAGAVWSTLAASLDIDMNIDTNETTYKDLLQMRKTNERVEWNPAGDTWLPATVVNDWGDDLLILLDENQQHMQVGRKHCRPEVVVGD